MNSKGLSITQCFVKPLKTRKNLLVLEMEPLRQTANSIISDVTHVFFFFFMSPSPLSDEYYSGTESGEADVSNYAESCHTFNPSFLIRLCTACSPLSVVLRSHLSKPPTNPVCQQAASYRSFQRLKWSLFTA